MPARPNSGTQANTGPSPSEIASAIEEDIIFGLLYPRERLVEDDLMERFGAKRHAVRSALLDLESRGAVQRKTNVGAFVRAYTSKEVRDLYAVRELLETNCARTMPTPIDAQRLQELIAVQLLHDQAVDSGDLRGAVRANMTFHQSLFSLNDNAVLVEAIQRYAQMTYAIRSVTVSSPDYLQRSREDHWAMIDALRAGDLEALASRCAQHLAPSRDAYLQRVENT
ncbi:GntR family transcriptional regulator [Arthrobacter mobilis]|uniref:GntR family transcriptional regulator n=1 Tax=Arthrobacter mobilis TaxID=2724944 RepID=A0A7X6K7H1_9MICC|nr:GntR family transcriptional regulator [Arthrobacter mobilis]NKX56534.1 GntR family transcriptional regulator [Arthrobacter mobilis]